jgi:hypothetical protein
MRNDLANGKPPNFCGIPRLKTHDSFPLSAVRDGSAFPLSLHLTTLSCDVDDLNAQFRRWRDEIAHQRRHPEHPDQTVAQIFAQEQPRLLLKDVLTRG